LNWKKFKKSKKNNPTKSKKSKFNITFVGIFGVSKIQNFEKNHEKGTMGPFF
jgi:hypothetical protein